MDRKEEILSYYAYRSPRGPVQPEQQESRDAAWWDEALKQQVVIERDTKARN